MSALIEALEIIKQYHIEHPSEYRPEIISRLKPGLSRKEIDNLTKNIPYTLPEEVYELYQWHNGIDCTKRGRGWSYFIYATGGIFGFLPLEEALRESQMFLNSNYYQYEPNWLLIFNSASDNNAAGCVAVLGEEAAVIRSFDPEDEYYEVSHTSMTNMMLNNALAYQNLIGKDFSGGDFRNLRLHKVNLTNTNLESADFRGANLIQTNLEGANIKNIKIAGAFYSDTTIFSENIDKSELIYVGANANLSNLDLRNIYFNNMNLENTNFSNANLAQKYLNKANLKNANLSGANLERANLEGADLSGANLEGANLNGANLCRAIFYNTVMPDGSIENKS